MNARKRFGVDWRLAALMSLLLTTAVSAGIEASAYVREIEKARAERRENLTRADGWLTLIGLCFLEPGSNSIGSAPDNRIVLPKGPAHLGTVILSPAGRVSITTNPAADVKVDGREVLGAPLVVEGREPPTLVTTGTLTLYAIERGGRLALRVRDSESERRVNFAGIDYFPIDPAWRIEARWEDFPRAKEVTFRNILGQESTALVPGKAVFEKDGRTFELLPLVEAVNEPLMFVISDLTSGDETYEAARFVYADPPRGGKIVLDFNEALNPPCAFTPFATCPLPPKENQLPIAVRAGEKKYRGEHE